MILTDRIYSDFLQDRFNFSGTWVDFLSAIIVATTHNDVTIHNERDINNLSLTPPNSWLGKNISWALKSIEHNYFMNKGGLFSAAEDIKKDLLTIDNKPSGESEISDKKINASDIVIGKKYWLNCALNKYQGPVIITKVSSDGVIRYYEDKPIRTKVNRLGREVVVFDPQTIQNFAMIGDVREIIKLAKRAVFNSESMFLNDAPPRSQINAGYVGPHADLSVLDGLSYTHLTDSDKLILAGHVYGWKRNGASGREVALLADWVASNLLQGLPPDAGGSAYTPRPLFGR